ncbi:MAG: M20 family metallopeptidase [Microgenomates group bacterium]
MISKKTLNLLKKYCNLDTSRADGAEYSAVLDLLEPELQKSGFATERIEIPEQVARAKNRVNLLAELFRDASLPTLLIYNHIDVVPANYEGAFELRVKNGRAYARGTADHKGSTVAVLEALSKIDRTKLRFNLKLILTTDEETDQLPQLEYLEKFLQIDPKDTLCFDPDTFAGGITTGHLGIYQAVITVIGKSVHCGMSHVGINAIEQLMSLQKTLSALSKKYTNTKSNAITFPKNGKAEVVRSSFNCTKVSGGLATNIIPDQVSLSIDVRFSPELDVQDEIAYIKKTLLDAARKQKVQLSILDGEQFEGHASSHSEIAQLEKILLSETGESGQYCVPGSSPVAQWTKNLGIPHFGVGVARYESNMHGVDESCLLSDIETLSKIVQKYLTS